MKPLAITVFLLAAMGLTACGGPGDDADPGAAAPAAPSDVRATPGPGYATLTWTDNSDNETGFVIYRDDGASTGGVGSQAETKVAEVGADVERYHDLGIALNTSTSYRVSSVNEHGSSQAQAAPDLVTIEPGVDLMVGTNDRRFDDGLGTVFVAYLLLPEEVLADDSLLFEGRIEGPAGWNGGEAHTYARAAEHRSRRSEGFELISMSGVDAVAGEYAFALTVGDDTYQASATLTDAGYKLGAPTNMAVTDVSESEVTVSWDAPTGTLSTVVALWRGDFEEQVTGHVATTDTTMTFEGLELEDGAYSAEVAPMKIDMTGHPVRVDPFGISYDSVGFVLGSGAACTGQPIDDPALAAAIGEELGLAGEPTCADLASLQFLSASERGIETLEGLQFAPGLLELDIAGNEITDLSPVAGLTSLVLLNARDNDDLSDISALAHLSDLEWLGLNRTAVRDIHLLDGMDELRNVSLEGLELDDADLQHLANLAAVETLHLADNQITDLSALSGLATLEELELQDNAIGDIALLAGFSDLRSVWISNNPVSDLAPLAGLTQLTRVRLDETPVEDIDALAGKDLTMLGLGNTLIDAADLPVVESFSNLEGLYLWGYGPEFADMSWLGAFDLVELEYADNGVSDLSVLEEMDRLDRLDVSSNDLEDISPLVANASLADGSYVNVEDNLLDLSPGADALADVEALLDRGVELDYEAQRAP